MTVMLLHFYLRSVMKSCGQFWVCQAFSQTSKQEHLSRLWNGCTNSMNYDNKPANWNTNVSVIKQRRWKQQAFVCYQQFHRTTSIIARNVFYKYSLLSPMGEQPPVFYGTFGNVKSSADTEWEFSISPWSWWRPIHK